MKKLTLILIGFCLLALTIAGVPSFASSSSGNQSVRQMQAQANNMKERIIEERDREIEAHTSSVQDKIQTVNEAAEIEIARVPQFFYNGWGYPVPNPDYERTVAYIRVDAQKQIYAINKDLAAMTKTINATYQEKLNAIDSSVTNVGSQARPGTSEIQLTPQGSNLYVKNYVNYVGDDSASGRMGSAPTKPRPYGLKARENSLACKATKRIQQNNLQP